jgi:hypothetical protein
VDNRRLEEPAAFVLPRIAEIPREQRCGRDQMLNFGNGSPAERRSRWLVQTIKKANAAQFSNYPDPCVKRAYDRVSLVEIIRSKIAIKAI